MRTKENVYVYLFIERVKLKICLHKIHQEFLIHSNTFYSHHNKHFTSQTSSIHNKIKENRKQKRKSKHRHTHT